MESVEKRKRREYLRYVKSLDAVEEEHLLPLMDYFPRKRDPSLFLSVIGV